MQVKSFNFVSNALCTTLLVLEYSTALGSLSSNEQNAEVIVN